MDFSIRTAPATFFKISGTALNPTPVPSPLGFVDRSFNSFALLSVDAHVIDSFAANQFPNAVPANNRGAGEFEIRNVRPGIYELYPDPLAGGVLAGRTIVDVNA